MVDQGLFVDERIELLKGAIVETRPQGAPHAATVQRLTTRLVVALAGRAEVRIQLPGDRYTRVTPYRPGESIRLCAFGDVEIPVSSILR